MTGKWTIAAQLSTSHSSACALDPSRMMETVRRVREAIDLDLLVVGFREAPEVFRLFCGATRPVSEVFLWYNALSDIEGMEETDLVVNWKGEASRGWGGWAEKGAAVQETFRFVCPNNPAVREKTRRRLRELVGRYAFSGVFLDKIRFPSPANGIDETLSCFCGHCRRAAGAEGLDLDAVAGILRIARSRRLHSPRGAASRLIGGWRRSQPPIRFSRAFSHFAPTASPVWSQSWPRKPRASAGRFRSTCFRPASPRSSGRTIRACRGIAPGRSR